IKNGSDRSAMTWLKEYFGATGAGISNCQNTTGLAGGTVVDPEPQVPYKGTAWAIPGKIEAEDFDVPGKGRNEDGTTNQSFSVANSGNGNSDYRKDLSPNLYKNGTGVVVGYNNTGNWYEYTVNVAKDGEYTMYAAVASAAGGAFTLSMDGLDITKSISVPAAKSGTDSYDEYEKVSAKVKLSAGKHIMRLTVDKEYFDIDYMTFVEGDGDDPQPVSSSSVDPASNGSSSSGPSMALAQDMQLEFETRQDFDVFDMQGVFVGRLSGYSFEQAINTVKHGDVKLAKGVYYIRNKGTKQMMSFTIAK
ncbi:MAG: carbohydrate-binding protein, partial [Fibrobacter sp.]|nr:carbohydrate-binding protein [Fibrobacter sp.]